MNAGYEMRRRDFLKASAALGGGLVLGFYVPARGEEPAAIREGAPPLAPNAWLRIDADGTLTVLVSKSEMGQGVYTSMPMLIAEELEADWSLIRVEAAPADPLYRNTIFGIQVTGGSTSVSSSWEQQRLVGAAMREMLIAAAAAGWGVAASECRARQGQVIHEAGGRRASYGSLAEAAAKLPVPGNIRLKDPKDFRIIGTSVARLDIPAKIDGSAGFGLDVQIPGMLVAVVARCPVFGGRLKSFDAEKARKVPGVKAVARVPSGVAVAAVDYWSALQGREALELEWEPGEGAELSSEGLYAEYEKLAQKPGVVARKQGDADRALAQAPRRIEALYRVPYLAHATMEPLNCAVRLTGGKCEIWTGTQFQGGDRIAAAKAAGLSPEQIHIHTQLLGGGFGRRANPHSDFVVEAVEVAKAVQAPVKVVWSREDDTRGGYYRPLWVSRLEGALDAEGNPLAWTHRIAGQSIIRGTAFEQAMLQNGIDGTSVEGAADLPYAIANLQVELHSPQNPVTVQWWRSVGHSHTGFVVESFLDELAAAGRRDPLELRRELLKNHPRERGVLERAAREAGWGNPIPDGRFRGLAQHKSFGSFVAQVAEISVDDRGRIRVHRVHCAVDCGRVVNPDTVRAQMESGIIFGLTAALKGEISLEKGQVRQSNFHDYPLLRLDECPEIAVFIIESSEEPTGVGEPGVPPVAAALANALFAATGARVRQLPMTPERVKAAMDAAVNPS